MRLFLKTSALLSLLIALYAASEIIEKGQTLNHALPFPLLGWLFWGVLVYVLWVLILQPIWQFYQLCAFHASDIEKFAKSIRRELHPFFEPMMDDNWQSQVYKEINDALSSNEDGREKRLAAAIDHYFAESERGKSANELVMRYSEYAALGVVISRNPVTDGLVMLILQMKMIVELATLFRYKPSLLFNSLCFCWVLGNSIVSSLCTQEVSSQIGTAVGHDFAEKMSSLFVGEDEVASVAADSVGTHTASATVSLLLEAVMSGATVYITGSIFSQKLMGYHTKLDFKQLVKLRRKGRIVIGKKILTEIPKQLGEMLLPSVGEEKSDEVSEPKDLSLQS